MESMEPIRLLIVDNDESAADLLAMELAAGRLRIRTERADTPVGVEVALRWFEPDVVLSKVSLPGVEGARALELVQEVCPHTPFIFILNTLQVEPPEEAKQRATDCVRLTDRPRLLAAVRNAASESRARRSLFHAERALKNSEVRFRLFMHNLPGAAYIKTPDGRFTYLNAACERILGRPAEQVIGLRLDQIFPPDVAAAFIENDQLALNVRQQVEVIEEAPSPEGLRTFLSIKFPLLDADGKAAMVGGISIDITKHVLGERHLARLTRLQAMLSAVNAVVVRAQSRDTLLQGVCRAAVEAGGLRMAWVGWVDEGRTKIDPVASYGGEVAGLDAAAHALSTTAEESQVALQPTQIGAWESGLAAEAVWGDHVVVCDDIERDPRIGSREAVLERGCRSLVALPLTLRNETRRDETRRSAR